MHQTTGEGDPAAAFPLPTTRDDARDPCEASRAVAISAAGLTATGLIDIECSVDPDLTTRHADELGLRVADAIAARLPSAGSRTWAARSAPSPEAALTWAKGRPGRAVSGIR